MTALQELCRLFKLELDFIFSSGGANWRQEGYHSSFYSMFANAQKAEINEEQVRDGVEELLQNDPQRNKKLRIAYDILDVWPEWAFARNQDRP